MTPPVSKDWISTVTQPLRKHRNEPLLKRGVSNDARQQVLTLRRSHSLREVAAQIGLPLGTVKTICARSGECFAFRSLARIQPKTKAEAIAVFRHLADSDRMNDTETESILLNLIG